MMMRIRNSALAAVPGLTIFPMYLALLLFFQTFPDGKFYPRRARLGSLLILANYARKVSDLGFAEFMKVVEWVALKRGKFRETERIIP